MVKNTKKRQKRLVLVVIGGILLALVIFLLWAIVDGNRAKAPNYTKATKIKLSLFTTGLKDPTAIVATPNQNDNRLFILERSGQIRIVDDNGQLKPEPFLDIRSKVFSGGEMGSLGLAFHPQYPTKKYFYINYINQDQETIIARYNLSSDDNKADENSEKILIRLKQPYTNHNGGDLAFGPDGYLYIALGDGGNAGDPGNRAQNTDNLFGKILRIDIDKGEPYAIPPTNPFINQINKRPEIWAYGLRNPWRISFDKKTGDLYIADVGQGDIEEVNLQKADSKGGVNYGWRCFEGTKVYNNQNCQDPINYTMPIFEYNHEESRCSVTGGYVYRGNKYPTLDGKYFYGDYCGGQLYYAENINNKWQQTLVVKTSYSFTTFGQDNSGELYVADFANGNIYKIIDQFK